LLLGPRVNITVSSKNKKSMSSICLMHRKLVLKASSESFTLFILQFQLRYYRFRYSSSQDRKLDPVSSLVFRRSPGDTAVPGASSSLSYVPVFLFEYSEAQLLHIMLSVFLSSKTAKLNIDAVLRCRHLYNPTHFTLPTASIPHANTDEVSAPITGLPYQDCRFFLA
jgi:hypothetical protein